MNRTNIATKEEFKIEVIEELKTALIKFNNDVSIPDSVIFSLLDTLTVLIGEDNCTEFCDNYL